MMNGEWGEGFTYMDVIYQWRINLLYKNDDNYFTCRQYNISHTYHTLP